MSLFHFINENLQKRTVQINMLLLINQSVKHASYTSVKFLPALYLKIHVISYQDIKPTCRVISLIINVVWNATRFSFQKSSQRVHNSFFHIEQNGDLQTSSVIATLNSSKLYSYSLFFLIQKFMGHCLILSGTPYTKI